MNCPAVALKGAGFAALHTLSPQLFYAYYRTIIPGLPAQWVIRAPDWPRVTEALLFAPEARLAEHLAALLFWAYSCKPYGCNPALAGAASAPPSSSPARRSPFAR